ncbi:MAG: exopolyphosphatase [Phycisphaerales bacterium]|nr:exopolyphosphatase [Phycisphaerae bacterium]NNF42961.1 exopolyphosphatase [Phycisphaerales bacterium]NNM27284.1 exopolyphosphatase [Phycisphaerales bacterium]
MGSGKYRLLTRSDFDGLVCAVLLKELDLIDDIKFVHPKDVQDGVVDVTKRDILTNVPYVEECHLCFDHHDSEEIRVGHDTPENLVLSAKAASAARVVYDHFGGPDRFSDISNEMMEAVDKADSANFTQDEILNPSGWNFLSFLMDARTGLGRFREFRVSNYQLMMQLIDCCRDLTIEQILELADVKERIELYREHEQQMKDQIRRCSTVHGPLVVLDLRREDTIYVGNRFMIYALFPEASVSMHVIWGLRRQNTVFAIGKSILNRTNPVDIGALTLEYGGGGHTAAGTCQITNTDAERTKAELIRRLSETDQRSCAA